MTFKPEKLPTNAKRRYGVDPWEGCQRAMRWLYYGDPDRSSHGESTIYRGAVVVGVVLRATDDGEPFAEAGGHWIFDDSEPGYAKVLAEQLRAVADKLDREGGS